MAKSSAPFLESFRRITSSGNYMPEIDGLRFVSIFWVVVVMHLVNLLNKNLYDLELVKDPYLLAVSLEGGHGVAMFFMISGFILVIPFLRQRLYNGQRVSLKKYYIRRLLRLEPPYLVALTLSFILLVYFVDRYSFRDLFPHYGASAVYMHNILYEDKSIVLPIAWSLEIEVQFYILAPVFSLIFLIKKQLIRRLILVLLILVFAIYAYYQLWNARMLLPQFLCYFFSGMLLADLYHDQPKLSLKSRWVGIGGVVLVLGLPFMISLHSVYVFVGKLALMNLFFYLVLVNDTLKKLMSGRMITIIGGMCYSIYLLHLMVMAAISKGILSISGGQDKGALVLYIFILLGGVLIVSALFYKLVEQPCMKPDWFRNIFRRKSKLG